MKHAFLVAIVLMVPAIEARPRVAVLNTQKALLSTRDGKTASTELERKYAPGKEKVDNDRVAIDKLRARLQETSDDSQKSRLQSEIRDAETRFRRLRADFQAELEKDQIRVLKDLTARLMPIIEKYAKQKHFEVVLDESDPKAAILWRDGKTDITEQVIKLYDQQNTGKKH